jgi:hypothetical protein
MTPDERELWALDQLLYYLPTPLDTEASKVFEAARARIEELEGGVSR